MKKSLYLVTKLFVEGSNPVREIGKYISNPGVEHWRAVEKFTGYLRDKEDDIKLMYRKPRELQIVSSIARNLCNEQGRLSRCIKEDSTLLVECKQTGYTKLSQRMPHFPAHRQSTN
jgi:hypothetical protein